MCDSVSVHIKLHKVVIRVVLSSQRTVSSLSMLSLRTIQATMHKARMCDEDDDCDGGGGNSSRRNSNDFLTMFSLFHMLPFRRTSLPATLLRIRKQFCDWTCCLPTLFHFVCDCPLIQSHKYCFDLPLFFNFVCKLSTHHIWSLNRNNVRASQNVLPPVRL